MVPCKLLYYYYYYCLGGTDIKCTFSSHTAWVSCVAWSPSHSHHFISGSHDQFVKLWDTRWYTFLCYQEPVLYPSQPVRPKICHGLYYIIEVSLLLWNSAKSVFEGILQKCGLVCIKFQSPHQWRR